MSNATFIVGDTRDVLRTLPDASVDLVMTSPPFLALRSYLPADHPDKAKEIGSEATPGAFLDVLLDVVVELRRVLAPHGSLCVELGDTYSGNERGAEIAEWNTPGFSSDGRHAGRMSKRDRSTGWPLNKSLCMVPQSFAWALAYGRNPWTGRELEPWRVRNIVRWCRPNPPVGALGDKFRPATSEMVVACVSGSRYFDLDAVREPVAHPNQKATRNGKSATDNPEISGRGLKDYDGSMSAGAPPLDYWVIPTHPYPGSHYATFPPELCVKPIKAMCPEKVCRMCGKPSERIVRISRLDETASRGGRKHDEHRGPKAFSADPPGSGDLRGAMIHETLGWSDCGHDDYRRGIVLDPFAGSGTTLEVATGHGRDAIGIDLDPRNADLARQRVGMFLEVAS